MSEDNEEFLKEFKDALAWMDSCQRVADEFGWRPATPEEKRAANRALLEEFNKDTDS